MSYTKEITIWCDGCAAWVQFPESQIRKARTESHKEGWITVDNKEDYCPACLADAKAGI